MSERRERNGRHLAAIRASDSAGRAQRWLGRFSRYMKRDGTIRVVLELVERIQRGVRLPGSVDARGSLHVVHSQGPQDLDGRVRREIEGVAVLAAQVVAVAAAYLAPSPTIKLIMPELIQ